MGVGYYRPHIPLFAPSRYFERFKEEPAELPAINKHDFDDLSETAKAWATEAVTAGRHDTVLKHGQWQSAVEAYLACTTFVDTHIGQLIDALDAGQFGDNTIIVLWSDHGWHLGEKQHWGKWTGWERSTRVPLVIVPPKRLTNQFAPAGSRCNVSVSLIDLYPTLVALCRLNTPDGLDGDSLVPLMQHPNQASKRSVVTSFDPGNVSVRDARWRLIRYKDESTELYDLKNDPNEWKNLAGDSNYQQQVERLSRELPRKALSKNRN